MIYKYITDEEKKKKENCSSSLISRVMPEFKVGPWF